MHAVQIFVYLITLSFPVANILCLPFFFLSSLSILEYDNSARTSRRARAYVEATPATAAGCPEGGTDGFIVKSTFSLS